MSKKTLEEYEEEFEKFHNVKKLLPKKLNLYEDLIKKCIYDYEDNELGYCELGNVSINQGDYNYANSCFEIAFRMGLNKSNYIKILNPPINNILIQDFVNIGKIAIDNLLKNQEIYFLGENGVGKTLLLQAITRGLVKNVFIENNFKYNKDKKEHIKVSITDQNISNISYLNFFAYGTSRFRSGLIKDEYFDKTGYETIFDRNKLLTDVEWWLKDLQRKELLNKTSIKLLAILKMLEDIVNFDNDTELKIFFDDKTDQFLFIEKGTTTKFEHLADGYRSVLIWLCDLLRRLTENQPYITDLKNFYGIVLIDEIDMFLHPKWEYTIVSKLREKLPNIQWFFTTHSPMLVLGASEDAVFYKIYKEKGKTQISEQYTYNQISTLLANGIITSPLFGMEYSGMREQTKKERPEIDTADTYLHSRINKHILQKSHEAKQQKLYIAPETIDQWILEALELNEAGKL